MDSRFQLTWMIDNKNAGKLIKDFLKEEGISKTALTDIKFKGGSILVNAKDVNVRYKLQLGDRLLVIFPAEKPSVGMEAEKIGLNIIFEDDFLLVVNKPAGMSTIPSREHPRGSLANALIGYYQQKGIQATCHVVTRLDRDTSGIVLIAKHRHIHHLFSEQQKKGLVKRTYEAIAEGEFHCSSGSIVKPIGRKEDSIIEREVREDGQYACTHYKVLRNYADFTYLELSLDTGRTHQIRVHLSYMKHPLLGDDLYGGDCSLINRQALHCKKLQFNHPILGENKVFRTSCPSDMQALLKAD